MKLQQHFRLICAGADRWDWFRSENAALPHGSGTDRILTDRDFVLIDAGGTFKGYVADVTRVSRLVAFHMSHSWLN